LPDYEPGDIPGAGTPLFSFRNNEVGMSGLCVRTDDIPVGFSLFEPPGCPIPCNPTWNTADIAAVCGGETFNCCETQVLDEDDCVFDETLQRFRPANGQDALDSLAGGDRWRPTENSTHQDPAFDGCELLAGGDRSADAFVDCVAQLGVADQRGYCMSVPACPSELETFVDACETLNG
jgi:hypothetical protein